ncbi:uncharacterized protein [Dysidea avara]|uniref:uncharacterized protein n=1 Tax=Dysidea avara TaxID=196820 RepID=UPI00331A72F0
MIENDCYCHTTDRVFYRFITFGCTSVWILFLLMYAIHSVCFRNHISRRDNTLDEKSRDILQKYRKIKGEICDRQQESKDKVVAIVAATVLNIDQYYDTKRELEDMSTRRDITEWRERRKKSRLKKMHSNVDINNDITHEIVQDEAAAVSCAKSQTDVTVQPDDDTQQLKQQILPNQDIYQTSQDLEDNKQHETSTASWHLNQGDKIPLVDSTVKNADSCRWNCFMIIKFTLLVLRFVFRLLIVPLLQFQWLSNYAWNCIMDGLARDYCKTTTSQYFIGLDHSLVLYAVYVMILVTVMFGIIIAWLPKGTPQILLHYSHERNSKIDYIDIKRKKIESR